MEADECPICTEPLSGTLATLGCCGKVLHVECFVKCMKVKLDCPMCRARHDNLRMVQDVESQVFVPVAVEYRNKNVFRELFTFTLVTSVITLSCLYYR
jgi:hypothetical protein